MICAFISSGRQKIIFICNKQRGMNTWTAGAICLFFVACGGNDKQASGNDGVSEGGFGDIQPAFKKVTPPYQLSDTFLLKSGDTATLPAAVLEAVIPDSVKKNLYGKAKPTYLPMARWEGKEGEQYYLVQSRWTGKRAALLFAESKDGGSSAFYPFLLVDAAPSTSQSTSVDKNFTVTKTVVKREGGEVTGEGKEVVAYDAAQKSFNLIMTDLLNESTELVNPIDTVAATHKLTGDYLLNSRNLLSIRDGRTPNGLRMYLHTETADGACRGELRGDLLITSGTTAVYRQSGDPCELQISFKGARVTVAEQSGCGNHRGLDCPLAGTFTRKKAPVIKAPAPGARR